MDNNNFGSLFKETPAAEGGNFAPIPEGAYAAQITEAKLDLAKEPPRLNLTLVITDESPSNGRKLFINYNLGGEGIQWLKKDLDTLELNYEKVGSEEDIAELIWANLPMDVEIFTKQREYNGKIYNNTYINNLLNADGTDKPGPTNQKEADRQEKIKTQPKTEPKTGTTRPKNHAPQTSKTSPKQEPKVGDDDEIPF